MPAVGFRTAPTMPLVQNEMLCFQDSNHVDAFLDYLTALSYYGIQEHTPIEDTDTVPYDDKLDMVESYIGFTSLRKIQNNAFEQLNEVGFLSPADIPKKDFILSSAFRSILNEYREVKVGSSIYVFFNREQTIEIAGNDLQARDQLRSYVAAKGNSRVPDFLFFKDNMYLFPHGEYSYNRLPSWQDTTVRPDPPVPPRKSGTYRLRVRHGIPHCSDLSYRLDLGVSAYDTSNITFITYPNELEYEVKWGDGSVDFYTKNDGQDFSIYKTYASSGVKNIEIRVRDRQGVTLDTDFVSGNVPSYAACSSRPAYRDSAVFLSSNNNFYTYTMLDLGFRNPWYRGWNTEVRITALTEAYYREPGTSGYKRKKAERLSLQCYFKLRAQNNCSNLIINAVRAEWPYDAKKVEICELRRRTEGFLYIQNDISSIHQSIWDGQFTTLSHELPGCN